jgi:hypothetical protein
VGEAFTLWLVLVEVDSCGSGVVGIKLGDSELGGVTGTVDDIIDVGCRVAVALGSVLGVALGSAVAFVLGGIAGSKLGNCIGVGLSSAEAAGIGGTVGGTVGKSLDIDGVDEVAGPRVAPRDASGLEIDVADGAGSTLTSGVRVGSFVGPGGAKDGLPDAIADGVRSLVGNTCIRDGETVRF